MGDDRTSGRGGELPTDDIMEALRQSEERYRTLFEQAPIAVFLFDRELRLIDCNAQLAVLLRTTHEALVGLDLNRIRDQKILPALRRALTGEHSVFEGTYEATMSEARVEVSMRLSPLRDARGLVVGGLGMVEDVTERRLMQARLLQADRMASVGRLAAGVAHEINNPLAYVLANLEGVAKRALPALLRDTEALAARLSPEERDAVEKLATAIGRAAEMVEIAREGAGRVRDVVRDLRAFSRADEETLTGVDVRAVLDASINMAWNEIRHRARLEREYGEAPLVQANQSRLGQVFLNLLVNAAQALPDGAAGDHVIRVRVFSDDPSRVVVEVIDTGEGILPEQLARIFDPFFTTKPVGVGTGLGLWICQGIVARLGGEITAKSQVGRGSTFRVVLPTSTHDERPAPAARAVATPPPPRRRILVVDDEPALARAIASALTPEHEVVVAGSGRKALELLAREPPFDLVLCDLMMPDVSGVDVHAELSKTRPDLARRVVFMTGGAFSPRARDFLATVPNKTLEKPFDLPRLLELVEAELADGG